MSAAERSQTRSNAFFAAPLSVSDPEIAEAIGKELHRQRDEIELIASETSAVVLSGGSGW